jgi:hypothetical protein
VTARINASVASMREGGAHMRLMAMVAVPADEVIFGILLPSLNAMCRKSVAKPTWPLNA